MMYVAVRPTRRYLDSPYVNACPICEAPAWHRCVAASGERRWKAHPERGGQVVQREPLPDLSDWWRSMKQYEGQFPKPRPADLVVP